MARAPNVEAFMLDDGRVALVLSEEAVPLLIALTGHITGGGEVRELFDAVHLSLVATTEPCAWYAGTKLYPYDVFYDVIHLRGV